MVPLGGRDELSVADAKGPDFKADEALLFEDRLVEEAGILYADEVSLEEVGRKFQGYIGSVRLFVYLGYLPVPNSL